MSSVGLTTAGEDEEHHIHLISSAVVELHPFDIGELVHRLGDGVAAEAREVHIFVIAVVFSIFRLRLVELHGAEHHEIRRELSTALVGEIVADSPIAAVILVEVAVACAIAEEVEEVLLFFLGLSNVEDRVLKFNKDDLYAFDLLQITI